MKLKIGFTKRDVAVVLGCIVFVLMNIAAVGSSGRRRAKEVVCLSNLHQWGNIFRIYTNEHDGYFMGGFSTDPSEHWTASLRPYYLKPGGITCCPEADDKPTIYKLSGSTFEPWGLLSNYGGYEDGDYGSYGSNTCIYNVPGSGAGSGYWRRVDVAGADNIPVFLDALWTTSYPWHTDEPPEYEGQMWYPGVGSGMGVFCLNRHNEAVNGLFMDWSVRKIGLKELWTLKWSPDYDVNGPWTIAGGATPDDWANHGTGWMVNFKDF